MPIQNNITAPDFNLADQEGKMHRLSDFKGKTVLLYFYPKDDTPGCTTEACNFRDDYSKYEKAGVVVLGVSPDFCEIPRQIWVKIQPAVCLAGG